MEILFVLGFFLMLLLTGVSLLGVIAALVVATVVMFVGGLFTLVFKLLPWLLLAVVAVWAWRYFQHADDRKLAALRRKISRLDRNSWR
ncbi:envelope stress response protein PspG [Candidatus Pantoea multigeneris]|uniref:Envelope stress response protein PspG n=1 Tax=Candidatus Pantoea multigeneris TaxID=2608357 RepID=A0ABX0RF84_9GAMM|nr:envelope stress response protein PspG [Pantoea multigeneris]NIF22788.1 envelope stress response protein PspG [Pantoea multigeneris]